MTGSERSLKSSVGRAVWLKWESLREIALREGTQAPSRTNSSWVHLATFSLVAGVNSELTLGLLGTTALQVPNLSAVCESIGCFGGWGRRSSSSRGHAAPVCPGHPLHLGRDRGNVEAARGGLPAWRQRTCPVQ